MGQVLTKMKLLLIFTLKERRRLLDAGVKGRLSGFQVDEGNPGRNSLRITLKHRANTLTSEPKDTPTTDDIILTDWTNRLTPPPPPPPH